MSRADNSSRSADALAPASARGSIAYLRTLASSPSRGWAVGFLLLFGVTVTVMTISSQLLGRLVDLIGGGSLPYLGSGQQALILALMLVSIALLIETLGRVIGGYLLNTRARRLSMELRRNALDAVLRAPVPKIMEIGTGNVITRLSKDIDTTVSTASMIGERLIITLLLIPISAVSLVIIHPLYLLLLLLTALLMYPWIKQVVSDIPAVANMVSSAEATRNNILLDTIRGMETLRQFRLGAWASKRMTHFSWETVQAWGDKVPLINRIIGQGTVVFGFLLVGALAMSVPMVFYGWISPGEATAAVLLVMRLEVPVFNLLFFAGEIQHAVTSLGRAVALATIAEEEQAEAEPQLVGSPGIVVENLSYSYPGGAPVLENLNLSLAPGSTTALVGTSGAGKSTLAALIAGLQYPTSGRILLGSIDTARVPNTWITQHIALITQEVHLFSGTLRDDLLLASPGANDQALWEALHAVGLTEDSRWLPQGLDTMVGAGNEEVGPEAAQQISLARMVLREPPVLIMDEATSEAGSEHAAALEHAARAVTAGRTALIVAHRLDQAKQADRILVMEQGRIVEDGTHAELLSLRGRYFRAYSQWENGSHPSP